MRRVAVVSMLMAGWLASAHPAEAQPTLDPLTGQVTGHLGLATGHDGRGTTASIGGSVAVLERNGWGAEFDAGFANDDDGRTGGLDVQSYMAGGILMRPEGRLRPYGVVGLGVLRIRTCIAGCTAQGAWTDWGWSGGGGVQWMLKRDVAVRGEARYFSALGDHPDQARPRDYRFWRVSAGVTYLWAVM